VKVLIFMTQFYQLSGAERLAVELAEELNRRGIYADILSMYTEDLPGVAEAKQALLDKGIPAVHFLGMTIHPPITRLVPAFRKLRHLIREHEYNIVETSMVSPTVIASWATRGTWARHVAGLHHVFIKERHNSKKDLFWRFSIRRNRLIRFYAISDYVAQAWVHYSNTSPSQTRTIYNAIPDDCFDVIPDRDGLRRELGISKDGRIVIYVGRLAKYKGIETLLDALGPVLEQENLFLLYVGAPNTNVPGTKQAIGRMEQRIAENRWSNRVKFLGYRKDVPGLLASADVLVHPSRTEGFGLTLAEAMAAGLPVVASNVEGIPEVLAGTDSIMVPPDDPDALCRAVLRALHRSPEEAAQAIEKGRKRAEDFRASKRTDAMIVLFEDVLSGRS